MKFLISLVPDGLKSYLRSPSGDDSLKRLVSWMAASSLCLFGYGLLLTMVWQIASDQKIDPALRDSFIGVVGFISALAMVAYRKPDAPVGGSDAPPKA